MSGNPKKLVRNKRLRDRGRVGYSNIMKDAVTIEEAAEAINRIHSREKREKNETREERKYAKARAKVSLPRMPWEKEKDDG